MFLSPDAVTQCFLTQHQEDGRMQGSAIGFAHFAPQLEGVARNIESVADRVTLIGCVGLLQKVSYILQDIFI